MNLNLIKYHLKQILYKLLGKTSFSRIQLNDWLKKIGVKADRVLEVGPSFNPVIKKVKKWQVKTYKTLDNNLENSCNPDFNLDLNHIDYKGSIVKKVFKYKPKVIFCLEVMEYVYKPDAVLKFFYDILAPEGNLYISFIPSILSTNPIVLTHSATQNGE